MGGVMKPEQGKIVEGWDKPDSKKRAADLKRLLLTFRGNQRTEIVT